MKAIKIYPNQKVVEVIKTPVKEDECFKIEMEALNTAAKNLTTNGSWKLYLYFVRNKDNSMFALSSSDFMEWAKVTKPTYLAAVKELIAKGYLVQRDEDENFYNFYDIPQDKA